MKVFILSFLISQLLFVDSIKAHNNHNPPNSAKGCAGALGLHNEFEKFIQARQNFVDNPTEDNLMHTMTIYDDLTRETVRRGRITPLHDASMSGNIVTIDELVINQSFHVDRRGLNGDTSLFTASESAVHRLLELGADPNAPNVFGDRPLHYFATYQNPQLAIDLLVSHGADVEAQNLVNEPPIYHAIQHGNIDAFHALRSHKASLKVRTIFAPNALLANYARPLTRYIHLSTDQVEFDEELETKENRRSIRTTMARLILDEEPSLLETVDFVYKANALHWASYYGDIDGIALLLERGLLPTHVNGDGETPLHVAARSNQVEAFRMLANKYPSLMEAVDNNGRTPMDSAQHHNADKVLELLIEDKPISLMD